MSSVTFITGNQNKADYLARYAGIEIAHRKIDLDELQSTDMHQIINHKVRQAYGIVGSPVLVEDISLEFSALNGLPGPFIKFFIENENGAEILCRMLDGFSERTAVAKCFFGYFDGETVTIIEDACPGTISSSPRGTDGYGWDVIFEMDGMNGKTNAELDVDGYALFQKRLKPFEQLKQFLVKTS